MHDPEVGEQLDRYRLTELLAQGGMASVFKAVDVDSGQEVVLKIPYIQYESDVVFYQRFEREEEIGQSIDHPGIVRVLAPREKSRMYLAMEYVPGRSLAEVMAAEAPSRWSGRSPSPASSPRRSRASRGTGSSTGT